MQNVKVAIVLKRLFGGMLSNQTPNHFQETIQISKIKRFEGNPRQGDIGTIKESLKQLGQYRPVVIHRPTSRILAGHHVVEAARQLGWTHVAITYVEGDEEFCKKVILADNRTNDLSSYRDDELQMLLESLPDLTATGFDEIPQLTDSNNMLIRPVPKNITPSIRVVAADYFYKVDKNDFLLWESDILNSVGGKKVNVGIAIARRLNIPVEVLPSRKTKEVELKLTTVDVGTFPIGSLEQYPLNPREGDVGAISESLRVLGQYRPIVANRRNRRILVGNHTWEAARLLGWKEISVVWVDVDEETEARIVLIDNRANDLAQYDNNALTKMLTSLQSLEGTGWDGDDVDDLLAGRTTRQKAKPRLRIQVAGYKVPASPEEVNKWSLAIPKENAIEHIAALLGLSPKSSTLSTEGWKI